MPSLYAVGTSLPMSSMAPLLPPTSATSRATGASLAIDAAPPASTVLQISGAAEPPVVYAPPTQPRSWARPPDDAISTLMNRNLGSGASLAARWKGLGAALLERLAQQPGDYQQTLALHSGGVTAADALMGVRDQAAGLRLQVQTRSGASVELTITVNGGNKAVFGGLQVEMRSTGPLSDAERQALGQLAEGLERAMAGLGRADAPELDLSGLLAYDQRQLASLKLTVDNPAKGASLRSFSLQLDDQDMGLQMHSLQGQLSLRVDRAPLLQGTGASQREAAISQYMAQFDAAAMRGHVDGDFMAQFKLAFSQLHTASALAPSGGFIPAATEVSRLQVAPLLSGLADFDASFEGTFERNNKYGFLVESSTVHYRSSQKTTMASLRPEPGNLQVTQTQNATLKARILRSLGEAEIDLKGGNYYITDIADAGSRTTTITLHDEKLAQAVEQQSQRQLLRQTKLLRHRAVETHETPQNWQSSRDLLRPQLPSIATEGMA